MWESKKHQVSILDGTVYSKMGCGGEVLFHFLVDMIHYIQWVLYFYLSVFIITMFNCTWFQQLIQVSYSYLFLSIISFFIQL